MILTESQILQIINEETRRAINEIASRHTVQRGDTFGKIAQKYGVSLKDLIAANTAITDINKIEIGDQVNIPGQGAPASGDGDEKSWWEKAKEKVGLGGEEAAKVKATQTIQPQPAADDGAVETMALMLGKVVGRLRGQIFRLPIPPPVSAALLFLAGVEGEVYLPLKGHKRAMYYTALAQTRGMGPGRQWGTKETGRVTGIHYGHYYFGQLLDPNVGREKAVPTYLAASGGAPASAGGAEVIASQNPYAQMSITIGATGVTKNPEDRGIAMQGNSKDGFIIKDTYHFPHGRDAERSLFSKIAIIGSLEFIWKQAGRDPIKALEEIFKWRQITGYKGYTLVIETGVPDSGGFLQGLFGEDQA